LENKTVKRITPSKSLNWTYRRLDTNPVYPPAAARVGDDYYQINGFESEELDFFVTEADSLEEALNMSVSLYGISTLNTVELANLTLVCSRMELDRSEIEAFEHHGIKGAKNFDTLLSVTQFCPVLKKYLSVKNIPLKTLAVFDKLENDFRRFVKNTVEDKEISVQEFRKTVNLLFDMQGKADESDMGPDLLKRLADKKNISQVSFMKHMQILTKDFPAEISSADNFETGELNISFCINNPSDFDKNIKEIAEKKEIIEKIYRFLNEQDIC